MASKSLFTARLGLMDPGLAIGILGGLLVALGFNVSDRYISFTEADGGMWKLHARQTIKEYLENALKDEISMGAVVVTL